MVSRKEGGGGDDIECVLDLKVMYKAFTSEYQKLKR